MLARCVRCQGTFSTDHFGVQTCPQCGSQVLLSDPDAPAGATPPPAPAAPPAPGPVEPPRAPPGPSQPSQVSPPPAGAGSRPGAWPPPPPADARGGPAPGWGQAPPPGWGPGAPSGPWGQPQGELAAPFAERRQRGFLRSYFETWKLAALDPAGFFRRVRIDQTGSAILFAVLSSTVATWISSTFAFLMRGAIAARVRTLLEQVPAQAGGLRSLLEEAAKPMSGMDLAASLLRAPVSALVMLFVGAGVIHLLLLLFGGAARGFGATLTAASYAFGLLLLGAVPVFGGLVGLVWTAVSLIIGLDGTQRCGTGKAAAAVLLPTLLLCAIGFVTALMAMGALVNAGGGSVTL